MLKNVMFISQDMAERLEPGKNWALISITGCGHESAPAVLKDGWGQILRLQFDDITKTYPNYISFSYQQAADVILFLHNISTKKPETTLIVHCEAGVSRSAAVAMFAAKHYTNGIRLYNDTRAHNTLVLSMLEYEYNKVRDYEEENNMAPTGSNST